MFLGLFFEKLQEFAQFQLKGAERSRSPPLVEYLHANSMVKLKDDCWWKKLHQLISATPYMFAMQFIFQNSKVHFRAIGKIWAHSVP